MVQQLNSPQLCDTHVCHATQVYLANIACGHAGRATAAARAGVADRFFKKHGRWRLESAKDGCVKDALETRLSVTKQLGI